MTTSQAPDADCWVVVRACERGTPFVLDIVADLSDLRAESQASGLRVPVAGFHANRALYWRWADTYAAELGQRLERVSIPRTFAKARFEPEVQALTRRLVRRFGYRAVALVGEWRRAVEAAA